MALPKSTRIVIVSLVAAACGLTAALWVKRFVPHQVSRQQFLIEVRRRHLTSATIYPLDHRAVASYGDRQAILTVLSSDDTTFATELRALGVEITFDTSDSVAP